MRSSVGDRDQCVAMAGDVAPAPVPRSPDSIPNLPHTNTRLHPSFNPSNSSTKLCNVRLTDECAPVEAD